MKKKDPQTTDKIIVILGQTSTGKSDFAVEIAKKVNGEIISADSRQVYKGMNLGTGKITKKEMRKMKHHLLDVASPKRVFSVSDFVKLGNKKIKDILKRGKVPIICGGTGFYIDSLINGSTFPEVPPNKKLRSQLKKKTVTELFKILKKLDKNRSRTIDPQNKVRLIRAIEIAQTLGKTPNLAKDRPWQDLALKIGLVLPPEVLKKKINTRLLSRIKKGMLKEIQKLHESSLSWKRMHELGLEYRYGALYLQNKISKEEMIEKINTKTWHYAKRQKTWFKRDQNTIWIDPRKKSEINKVQKEIKRFLN